MSRGDSLKRQWSLVLALQTNRYGLTLDELAEHVACNRRTIQRDINVLREIGLPISYETLEPQGQRRYALPHGYLDHSGLLLTITEALSLYLAKAFMNPLTGTILGQAFDCLVTRIEQTISRKTLRHFRDLQALFLVLPTGLPDYSHAKDAVAAIDTAVRDRRVLSITYHSQWRGDDYTAEVHPYGLVFWQSDLYLVAYSCRAGDMRSFKVTRIRQASLTKKTFQRPEDFDLEDYFSSSISISRGGQAFDATVRFTGPAMALVTERRWHPSQRIIDRSDNHLLVKLHISDAIGLKQWVRSFGQHAELLTPDRLRCELRDELLTTAALYTHSPKSV